MEASPGENLLLNKLLCVTSTSLIRFPFVEVVGGPDIDRDGHGGFHWLVFLPASDDYIYTVSKNLKIK